MISENEEQQVKIIADSLIRLACLEILIEPTENKKKKSQNGNIN